MSRLLSQSDLDRVAAKVAEVESKTAGEIVVHVVERSSGYGFQRAVYAAAGAYLVAQAAIWLEPLAGRGIHLGEWALGAMPLVALIFWLILGVRPILSLALPDGLALDTVQRRAEGAFLENRVHRTVDASGVLVFVSELERRVVILADEGIHARVGVEGWQKHVDGIVAAIRSRRPAEGLLAALDAIGKELAEHFPPRVADTNELPNAVVKSVR